MGPRGERTLLTAVLLVMMAVNIAAIMIAVSPGGPDGAQVGGVSDGSSGGVKASRDDGGLMPKGGDDDILGPPDEIYEDVEGPPAPENKQ
jgi:hypothetical protein